MKIGILTYHRTHNYGGCLQAVATRIVLEQMGHKVYYIDYWPEYHSYHYSPFSINKLIRTKGIRTKLRLIKNEIKYGRFYSKRKQNFESFIKVEIAPFCRPISESYDAAVYGSDQIWRKQPILNDYNSLYFADHSIKAGRYVAFSASMGNMPSSESETKKIASLLTNFDNIAVRENALKILCERLTDKTVSITADPTLLVSSSLWDRLLDVRNKPSQKYVLVYALHDTFDLRQIQEFAEKRGCILKVLYGNANQKETGNIITTAGPKEFLSLIKNAEFVFSSSFHGLAFSLLYGKQFYVSFKDNADRAKSLLANVGQSNRFLQPYSNLPENIEIIDYNNVNEKLQKLREESLQYLNNALS